MADTLAPGLNTSPIGFGCMALSHVYGGTTNDQARHTLEDALDAGITFLDTADVYGEPKPDATGPAGTNEEMLAPFVARHRDQLQIATKFGITGALTVEKRSEPPTSGRPEYVRAACDASLRRIEETIGALSELIDAGKVRHLGLSEVTAPELRRAHAVHPIAAVQSEWSLWSRDVERNVVPACAELGVGFVPYSPLGRGFLTGTLTRDQISSDFRGMTPRMGESWDANQQALAVVTEVADSLGATNAQVALAWLLAKGRQFGLPVVPIPGSRRAERMRENLGALKLQLDEAAMTRLDGVASLVEGSRNVVPDPRWISEGRE